MPPVLSGRYADGNGLYLVVDDSGAKRWLLRTNVAGKRRDIGLGSVRLVDLAKARLEAARLRLTARSGGDPLSDRRRERRTMLTFEEAAKQVHANHSATFRNTKHKLQWLSSLRDDVFPVFGKRPVTRSTRRHIEGAFGDLDDEAGDGAATQAANQGRVRLGEGVWLSQGG